MKILDLHFLPVLYVNVFSPGVRGVSSGHIYLGVVVFSGLQSPPSTYAYFSIQNNLSLLYPRPAIDDPMAPPSSCIISGVFSLFDGSRDSNTRYHATYFSPLDSADTSAPFSVSIRKYTALADPIYPEGSLVFIVAKAALLIGEDIPLDSIHCASFDPSVESLPGDLCHTAVVAGTVSAVDDSVPARRSFTLAVSEYVRDERRAFHVRFVIDTIFFTLSTYPPNYSFQLDGTSNRWKNTPLPSVGSTVIATGTFEGTFEQGYILNLLDVSFGAVEAAAASPTRTVGPRGRKM